jgi:hypothetical protein
MTRRDVTVALLAAAMLACRGAGADPDGDPDPGEPRPSFACDDTAAPAELPLRRLSTLQHRHTVHDLVTRLQPGHAAAVLTDLAPALGALVPDVPDGPEPHYARLSALDHTVSQAHVDRSYELAVAVGTALTRGARWSALADCDVTQLACLQDFVRTAGPVTLRRDLDDADVAFYLRPAADAPLGRDDWVDVLTLLLLSPDHLYHVETVQDALAEPPLLDARSLANRLAYHAWQAPPDPELVALARSGELLDEAVYQAQVARLFADDRARAAVGAFFDEWLRNVALEPLDSRLGTPVYDAFRADFTPTSTLRAEMLAEVTDSVLYTTFDADGTWDDVLTSDRSFARSPELASLYETPVWDGTSEPPVMTQPGRSGLVTRAALLATGSANTRPIQKGVFLRKALLCDPIPPPPADVAGDPPALQPDMSTRDFVDALTGGGECAACHAGLINPLGFVAEDYDALGRHRTEQVLLDPETGAVRGSVPIDTVVQPQVEVGSSEMAFDAHSLTALLVASEKPRACLTRHWFRFTFGRVEDNTLDGCTLAAMDDALDEGRTLREALRQLALSPAFRTHRLTAE